MYKYLFYAIIICLTPILSLRLITDILTANVGKKIGTKGETKIKVVFDYTGKIWTAYPVK